MVQIIKHLYRWCIQYFYTAVAKIVLTIKGVDYGPGLRVNGFIKIAKSGDGIIRLGRNVSINSGDKFNIIGRNQTTSFIVHGGSLIVKDNVGMSSVVIVCRNNIIIDDYVLIGGGTVIYDTDFHSLDANDRKHPQLDRENAKKGSVLIGRESFIGANSTILKNTTIGSSAIIGACSVVSGKQIEDAEIWAGNPAIRLS